MYSYLFILAFCFSLAAFTASTKDSDETARESDRCIWDLFEPWTHGNCEHNGQEAWPRRYPNCNGTEQSPIAINSKDVVKDQDLGFLIMIVHEPMYNALYVNDGHSVCVYPRDNQRRFAYHNGTFYEFQKVCFHFGCDEHCGSEHIIDGKCYAMEAEFVFKSAENRTLVVSVVFEFSDHKGTAQLEQIANQCLKIVYKNMYTSSIYPLYLNGLIPHPLSTYYMYNGSLSSPECTEGVLRLVVKRVMYVKQCQLEPFWRLFSCPQSGSEVGCQLCHRNIRRLQAVNGRTVYETCHPFF